MSELQIGITTADAHWDESSAILWETYVRGGYSSPERARVFCSRPFLEQHGTLYHATLAGRIAGVILLLYEHSSIRQVSGANEGEFRLLAVGLLARGHGAGRALVAHCLDQERRRGSTGVVICTQPSMNAAQRLYASFGFVRLPERDFDTEKGSSRWVYELRL